MLADEGGSLEADSGSPTGISDGVSSEDGNSNSRGGRAEDGSV